MEKRHPRSGPGSAGFARRREHRLRILGALQGMCAKIERLQPDEDARAACREVARLLRQARLRETSGKRPQTS